MSHLRTLSNMESDKCYAIDSSKIGGDDGSVFEHLRHELIVHGYVKIKCENLPDGDCDTACLNIIAALRGICCPYNDDENSFIWPVKVLELDSPSSKLQASQLDRELVFHTDCSYEHKAPRFVALYVVQCDRSEHGGKFQLLRTKDILESLSTDARQLLSQETYKINVPPDFRKGDIDYISGPIILDGGEHIRYRRDILDKNQLKEERADKRAAVAELNAIILTEDRLEIFRPVLENNMMILFDNRRFLHGRTKIIDTERYLLRVRFNLT